MCGIAGIYSSNLSLRDKINLIERMLKVTQHRGPDHTGYETINNQLVLGHNRLSILDLRPEGNQPFHYKHLTITFNGEIYNYKELKKSLVEEGYHFNTETDTEVILACYLKWGQECVNQFVGMWAFAIWDNKEEVLFCSRDRFGIKPFYYYNIDNEFYFASEIKALKQLDKIDLSLDDDMINMYLHLGWHTYRDRTLFRNIYQIEAATNLIVRIGQIIQRKKYWDIDLKKEKLNISKEDTISLFKEKFENSIQLHMRSDVPVGTTLSGGIDSSSITSVVAKNYPELQIPTFSIYYTTERNMDERKFIDAVVYKYPNLKSFQYEPTENEILDQLEAYLKHQDFPLLGSSFISHFFVMKMAHQHGIKVLLDGQGADEYLVGYLRSFYRLIGKSIFSPKGLSIFRTHIKNEGYGLKEIIERFGKTILSGFTSDQKMLEFEYLYGQSFVGKSKKIPFKVKKEKGDQLNEFLYNLLFYSELPRLLHYTDINSMYFSIESRVPFLDHRLVEFCFQVPNEYKVSGGITKYILRESMKSYLPLKVYERKDKKGFVTPGELRWLRGPLQNLNSASKLVGIPSINLAKSTDAIGLYQKGENSNLKLNWRLSFLNQWIKYA